MDKPVIAIIGAGAVGAYYGGRLAQNGHNVHFLLRSEYEAVKRQGWTIQSCDGDFSRPPQSLNVYNDVRKMPKADLVVVTLKSTSSDLYQSLIAPLIQTNTTIVALQNGLGNEEKLAELFGADHIIGAIAFVCINRIGPAKVHHMAEGLVRVGEFRGAITPRLSALQELFETSKIPCQAIDNLFKARWQKLIWNIPFNGLGAVLGLTTDQLLASSYGIALVRELMAEVIAVARAYEFDFHDSIIEQQIQFTKPMGAYKTSMQIDREQNRPLEIEAMIGEPLRRAVAKNISAPKMAIVYNLLRIVNLDKI